MTWRSLREQVVLEGRLRLVQLLGEKAFACWPVKFDVREATRLGWPTADRPADRWVRMAPDEVRVGSG